LRSGASFRSPGASPLAGAEAVAKFGAFYIDKLWDVFVKAVHAQTSS